MDQKIEETINKDIQTPGGKKWFSTKKMLYQGTTWQPIVDHLALDNIDTW